MSAHTPGPWEIADLDHGLVVRTESQNKSKYGASRYAAVGGFDRSNPTQLSEALANARLIAAAPDLLEALRMMLEAHAIPSTDCKERPAYESARAAIDKATGGQP